MIEEREREKEIDRGEGERERKKEREIDKGEESRGKRGEKDAGCILLLKVVRAHQ